MLSDVTDSAFDPDAEEKPTVGGTSSSRIEIGKQYSEPVMVALGKLSV